MNSETEDMIELIDECLSEGEESPQSLLAKVMRGVHTNEEVVYTLDARRLRYRNLLLQLKGMMYERPTEVKK
jgi:hypothetical protein